MEVTGDPKMNFIGRRGRLKVQLEKVGIVGGVEIETEC
jgi:hypothetical protein